MATSENNIRTGTRLPWWCRDIQVMIVIALALLSVVVSCCWQMRGVVSPTKEPTWKLVRVIDGDTIEATPTAIYLPTTIRLVCIDAPDRGQPAYRPAADALRLLLDAQPLRLEYEQPGYPARDRYGRLLAYVWAGDCLVNVEMVRLGVATFYTKYGEGRYAERFKGVGGR